MPAIYDKHAEEVLRAEIILDQLPDLDFFQAELEKAIETSHEYNKELGVSDSIYPGEHDENLTQYILNHLLSNHHPALVSLIIDISKYYKKETAAQTTLALLALIIREADRKEDTIAVEKAIKLVDRDKNAYMEQIGAIYRRHKGGRNSSLKLGIKAYAESCVAESTKISTKAAFNALPESEHTEKRYSGYEVYRDGDDVVQENIRTGATDSIRFATFRSYMSQARKNLRSN